ncbi:glycosyltransferase family 4 protein [Stutzerimonas kunmingensis]|uniref:glycosyltransferase family 4 protein n=1 Tax=Stutzerimonas kunmingensis TaxID=1211807 RepID=UPI0028B12A90|nr:glycosyltransferase family 4 protein [Stutzerimonas kunmingensis]
MKIVYFSSSILPSQAANSVNVVNMAEALAECGHDVYLIHEPGPTASDREIFSSYGLRGRFSLCPVRRPGLRYIGLLLYSLAGFVRYIRGSRAALVYSRDYLGALFAALAGYRTVFELHSMPDSRLTKCVFDLLLRCTRLSALVTISAALRDDVISRYPGLESRVLVAHDAANEHIDVMPFALGGGDALRVGYVGGLYQGKGVEVAVELARRMPSIEVHVVGGDGALLAVWRRNTASLTNLTFHGYRPHSEIASYIAAFDIVLLPNQRVVHIFGSKTDIARWTSPLKMFEYMAAGKPIISSDLPVLREVLEHERNCLLCPSDNIQSWVDAILRLQLDVVLRRRLAEKAKDDFRAKYSWSVRAESILRSLAIE